MAMRATIKFLRHGEVVELSDVGPNETVLDYLRLRERSTGTKEGCCEGDCGACTVAIGQLENGKVTYQPVNSCIQLLGSLDGRQLVTVEDLAAPDGTLHPVQAAMVKHHGSQCGFCTPGFVMSLFVLYHQGEKPDRTGINKALAGNLCRCTGYRPIVDAGLEACNGKPELPNPDLFSLLTPDDDIFIGNQDCFFASPASEATLARLRSAHGDAVIVAGATDVGLWITKQLRDLPKIIYLARVGELQQIEKTDHILRIGAGVTYAKAYDALGEISNDITAVLRRLGSQQVRAAGTIGGNIANGSPIGDMPPILIALDAQIELKSLGRPRILDLADFFIDYGKQDLTAEEYLADITIPRLAVDQHLACYKISKRFDQDISSVMAAFRFTVKSGMFSDARIAFGGMAATPKLATKTEDALNGLRLADIKGWRAAAGQLAQDFTPLSDMRASADYRITTAVALLIKCRAELSGETQTRIYSGGEDA